MRRLALVLATLLVAVPDAAAQCALCGQAAAAAGDPETVSRTFATAILVLLVPTLAVLAGTGLLLWRFRDGGPGLGGDAARSRGDAPRRTVADRAPRAILPLRKRQ